MLTTLVYGCYVVDDTCEIYPKRFRSWFDSNKVCGICSNKDGVAVGVGGPGSEICDPDCDFYVTEGDTNKCPSTSLYNGKLCVVGQSYAIGYACGSYTFGSWDASEKKCVTCFNYKEDSILGDTSDITSKEGDNQCESGCDAVSGCDELDPPWVTDSDSCCAEDCLHGGTTGYIRYDGSYDRLCDDPGLTWRKANEETGKIYYVGGMFDALSNGVSWIECDGDGVQERSGDGITVSRFCHKGESASVCGGYSGDTLISTPHDYICGVDQINYQPDAWFECCGDETCDSADADGVKKYEGDTISGGGRAFICCNDELWHEYDPTKTGCCLGDYYIDATTNTCYWCDSTYTYASCSLDDYCGGTNRCGDSSGDTLYYNGQCTSSGCVFDVSDCACGATDTDTPPSDGRNYTYKGTCTDYEGCSNANCVYSTYDDYCDQTTDYVTLIEYYVSGSADSAVCTNEQVNCENLDSTYVCFEGACQAGCIIDGTFYADNESNPNNPCEYCNASVNKYDWTPRPCGFACNAGTPGVCDGSANCYTNESTSDCLLDCSAPSIDLNKAWNRSVQGNCNREGAYKCSGDLEKTFGSVCDLTSCTQTQTCQQITGSWLSLQYCYRNSTSEICVSPATNTPLPSFTVNDEIVIKVNSVSATPGFTPLLETQITKRNLTGEEKGGIVLNNWGTGNIEYSYRIKPNCKICSGCSYCVGEDEDRSCLTCTGLSPLASPGTPPDACDYGCDPSGNWTIDYTILTADFLKNGGWYLQTYFTPFEICVSNLIVP